MRRHAIALLPVLLAILPACDTPPLEPTSLTAVDQASIAMESVRTTSNSSLLTELFNHSISVIHRTHGAEAAADVLARIERLRSAAAAARAEGNVDLARRLVAELHQQMAEVVVRVLGPQVADRVVHHAEIRVAELHARIRRLETGGHEVPPRVEQLAAETAGLVRSAHASLEADNPAEALLAAVKAIDLLNAFQRGSTPVSR
jgi:hypothetical protein